MDIRIMPGKLSGAVTPPPSKSVTHRAVLAQMLSAQPGSIQNLGESQDIQATLRCAAALKNRNGELPCLDCGESGSTLRFFLPVALALAGGGRFTGSRRLMERPLGPYLDLFVKQGIDCRLENRELTVCGTLTPGVYALPGNVSSQFVTGLLFALPLLEGDSEIRITTPLESKYYVDMTLDVLVQFGVHAENRAYETFLVPGGQSFLGRDITVEADWSQAAFWYAANFLDNQVTIYGLNPESRQGDRSVAAHYWRLARPGAAEIDLSECPDLLPPLAVMAAVRSGRTRFCNAARLRLKESDRLASTAEMLRALGGQVEERADELIVDGKARLQGGIVDGANDHRIVMAAAIAATVCEAPVTVRGAEAVRKSYPSFWDEYRALGGEVCVL